MSVKKIITPDAGILPVYVLLCTDVLVCHILHGQDKISVGISAGIAFGIGALGDVAIDLEEPLISPIPINLLVASGLGEVSFSDVLVLTNLPGYEGTVKFIGEKPLDVTLTGAYLDGAGLHCFDADGETVSCDDVEDALTGDEDICFDTDLFPVPAIDDAIATIIAFGEESFDLTPPEKTTPCTICLDGSLECDLDEIPFFTKSSPLETCTMPSFGEDPECDLFEINVESLVDEKITQLITDIDETVGDIEGVVGDIEGVAANAEVAALEAKAAAEEVVKCVSNQNFDESQNGQTKCQLINFVNSIRPTVNDLSSGLHDMCHDADFGVANNICHAITGH